MGLPAQSQTLSMGPANYQEGQEDYHPHAEMVSIPPPLEILRLYRIVILCSNQYILVNSIISPFEPDFDTYLHF